MIQLENSFHEISFLRISVAQLRQIALTEPAPVSEELRRIAQEWDARANGLEAAAGNQQKALIAA
jgi:hypothetical protein